MPGQRFKNPPSAMDRKRFVEVFGRIYEHSPWVAEILFDAGLQPAYDAVDDLHRAMAEIVNHAPEPRRLALLCAHPDLAGKLALRGEVTAESTGEQASAGLDKCTPEEFQRFSRLNESYKLKFGFPFIMAVKGRSRAEILAAFEARIGNTRADELRTATDQVNEIARLRLRDL